MRREIFDTIDGKLLKRFEVIKKIGQGGYGQVWKVKNKKAQSTSALKKICDVFGTTSNAQKTYRQIKYLQKLNHPNIVKLHSIHLSSNAQQIYLQLQFMEADLSLALQNSLLKPVHKHFIFYQITNAIVYLHSADLVHRDIKPTNVLVNEACDAKLCDFGLMRSVAREREGEKVVMTEKVATRWYRAPQILLGSNTYGKAADVWSLGCVLAQMIMQRPLFQGNSTLSQLQLIFEVTGAPSEVDLQFLQNQTALKLAKSIVIKEKKSFKSLLNTDDSDLVDLLERIFQVNSLRRPSAQRILAHPFISKFRGKVEQKNALNPIKILYDSKLLTIDDYKNLLRRQLSQKQTVILKKNSQEPEDTPISIYKTLPNGIREKLSNTEKTKFMHNSHLNQNPFELMTFSPKNNSISPLKRIKKQETKSPIIKKSPSFLKNRKKQKAEQKVTPDKAQSTPTRLQQKQNVEHKLGLKKKLTYPGSINQDSKDIKFKDKPEIFSQSMSNPEFLMRRKQENKFKNFLTRQKVGNNETTSHEKETNINIFSSMGTSTPLIPREMIAPLNTIGEIFSKKKQSVNTTTTNIKIVMTDKKEQTPTRFPVRANVKKTPFSNSPPSSGLTFKQRASPPLQRQRNQLTQPVFTSKKQI